jgi:uncharacterized protein (DUF2141 family)
MHMKSTGQRLLLGALVLGNCAATATADAANIDVHVQGVASGKGTVRVAVCDAATFLKKCPYNALADAHTGEVVVPVKGVPDGTYAVMVFHDENGNQRLDRNQMGIPLEGIGFSRDASAKYGPPQFSAAAVQVGAAGAPAGAPVRINLQY